MYRVANSLRFGSARRMLSTAADVPAACFLPAEQVSARVIDVVRSFKAAPPTVSASSSFVPDLGFDSMMVNDLIGRLGAEFCVDVPASAADSFYGIKEATAFFTSHPKAR